MSERQPVISEEAREDLALQYGWYAKEADIHVAERYLVAFRDTVTLLTNQAGIGVLRRFRNPLLKGLRSFQMNGSFRVHLVFYRMEAGILTVFRVMHGVRDLPRRLTTPPRQD